MITLDENDSVCDEESSGDESELVENPFLSAIPLPPTSQVGSETVEPSVKSVSTTPSMTSTPQYLNTADENSNLPEVKVEPESGPQTEVNSIKVSIKVKVESNGVDHLTKEAGESFLDVIKKSNHLLQVMDEVKAQDSFHNPTEEPNSGKEEDVAIKEADPQGKEEVIQSESDSEVRKNLNPESSFMDGSEEGSKHDHETEKENQVGKQAEEKQEEIEPNVDQVEKEHSN